MVCIIDDREDVWSYAPNLIVVKPYKVFKGADDINDPFKPELTLTDDLKEKAVDDGAVAVNGKQIETSEVDGKKDEGSDSTSGEIEKIHDKDNNSEKLGVDGNVKENDANCLHDTPPSNSNSASVTTESKDLTKVLEKQAIRKSISLVSLSRGIFFKVNPFDFPRPRYCIGISILFIT